METYATAAVKDQKLKLASGVIKAVDTALEQGLKVAHKGKHQIKLLQLHGYFALYQGKFTTAIQYIEQAKLLESKNTHILLKCTSRLLEAYIYALQLDHKIAIRLLRESLTIQTRHKVPELINSTQDLNWFFRLLVVTLFNIAVESFNLHLRQDALQFAEKAQQIVRDNKDLAPALALRVNRLHAALFPVEQGSEASPVPTEISEESKLPFIPGGRVEERPGKIVEMRGEERSREEKSHQRLPRVSPLAHAAPKANTYFQAQTPSKRYRSVPPSQRRKLMS